MATLPYLAINNPNNKLIINAIDPKNRIPININLEYCQNSLLSGFLANFNTLIYFLKGIAHYTIKLYPTIS